tara:strand:+ start:2702 stop:2899 length:198 start_codon:yes stop_codon:yes gene_type:complete
METDKKVKCNKCKSKRLIEDFVNKNKKIMKTCDICRIRDLIYRTENDELIKHYQKLYRDKHKQLI